MKQTTVSLTRVAKTHTLQDCAIRAVWDNVPDAAAYRLIHAPDGSARFECVSEGFESLFELPVDIILSDAAPLYGLLHPSDRDEAMTAQKHAAETVSPFRHECRFNLPSGKIRWIRWHSMPESLSDGGIAWNGVALDVTAREQAEAALRELNATLEQRVSERTAEAQQRSRQLAALTMELTLVEQRERRRLADYLHDHLQQLLVAARMQTHALASLNPQPHHVSLSKLSTTLTQAIEAARSVSRTIAPPVAVCGHLPEAFQWLVRDVGQTHNLAVEASVQGDLRDVPEAESILLFTAARELLLNVVKHSGLLQADLRLAHEGGTVVLEVRDAGRGIPPVAVASPQQNGFGLFSIRERIESMGGRLTVDSSPGCGMRVAISLPLVASPSAPQASSRQPNRVESVGSGASQDDLTCSGATRVLFADDHRIVRESLVSLLNEQTGIEIVGQCGDGRQAVEAAGRLRPDVVIMDVNMPVMDGIEATRHIKERWPFIMVIGLSMYDDADGGGKMRAAGADAYVSKSAPPEILIAAIRKYGRVAGRVEAAVTDSPFSPSQQ